jgi:SH3-like domain-containing protein
MVRGEGIQELRRSADPQARVVARAEPGVIGEFQGCENEWCRIEVEGERGWLPKARLWGAAPED